jgi:peptide/nickel transport system ATP-binding protein
MQHATTVHSSVPASNEVNVPVLELRNVSISYFVRAGELKVVPNISFKVERGEALGLVGESGCGKSTVAFAIMQYLGGAGRITHGQVLFDGHDLAKATSQELRAIRGRKISMVYQDPMSSLNPVIPIGRQLMEVPIIHFGQTERQAYDRALQMLNEVNLPDPVTMMTRYPHQLSGGQQQRVVIAMALMAEPSLLVMDEPTTGLDVTVEAAVLDLVARLREKHNTAIVFISHNLGTVVRVCDRIGVMYAGELVEEGSIGDVFRNPRHPYTRGLLGSIPHLNADKSGGPLTAIPGQLPSLLNRPAGCVFQPRCSFAIPDRCSQDPLPTLVVDRGHRVGCVRAEELPSFVRGAEATSPVALSGGRGDKDSILQVKSLRKTYHQTTGMFGNAGYDVHAVDDIDLSADRGQTLAIVGESGCGKSTLAKVLTGIELGSEGEVILAGKEISKVAIEHREAAIKRAIQMVFQNPDSTLNPSHSIGYAVGRAIRKLRGYSAHAAKSEVANLLKIVQLPPEFSQRLPRQLSGGQKQRVAIARALAGEPDVILADEPVSALDVSVQASIINLLVDIQAKQGATLIFISHDLSVVRYIADNVAVMYLGKVMEYGRTEEVFAPPYHPYTEALLSAVPIADPDVHQRRVILEGVVPSPQDRPQGCPFATRCPRRIGIVCDTVPPPTQVAPTGHRIYCHIPLSELSEIGKVLE